MCWKKRDKKIGLQHGYDESEYYVILLPAPAVCVH